MAERQFTCVSFDEVALLIPREYVVAAHYLLGEVSEKRISYNTEVLPYLNLSREVAAEFKCAPKSQPNFALIVDASDWKCGVRKKITEITSTEFPKSDCFALAFNAEIFNRIINDNEFSLLPLSVRKSLKNCGVVAVRFAEKKAQFLVALDYLIEKILFDDERE